MNVHSVATLLGTIQSNPIDYLSYEFIYKVIVYSLSLCLNCPDELRKAFPQKDIIQMGAYAALTPGKSLSTDDQMQAAHSIDTNAAITIKEAEILNWGDKQDFTVS